MSDAAHLDPAGLQRLQRLGGDAFVVKMIDLFFSYGAEKVAEAQRALAAGDLTALAKAVHPIKSSAGNVGAARMQALAQRIEELAKQGDVESVKGLVPELVAAFVAVKAELESHRATLSA
jgi:two-component system sensor histidine kinase/response regulator